MDYHHISVLKKEVIDFLDPKPNQNFIDCTLGGGGHALEILKKIGPKGKVLGIDLDKEAIEAVESRVADLKEKKLKENLILVQDNFKNLINIYNKNFSGLPVHGILLDLGASSRQFDEPSRGFSFREDGFLDMNFNQDAKFKAFDVINKWPQKKLEDIFRKYGEEIFARQIAKGIVRAREKEPIDTTKKLADVINKNIPVKFNFKKIHPATRVFQALRITVNEELENLIAVLPQILQIPERGGRVAIISFHSLEDRIVKQFFAKESRSCICPPSFPICKCEGYPKLKILTRKPIIAREQELENNPRSRSAKMRVAERV
ncbi:MAG: 16S rRNA (cytosine(1402)-N(4))-methyltransferase RsmH [bacterium]